MWKPIVVAGAAAALISATLTAQPNAKSSAPSGTAVRLQLAPGSQLSFEGTSTLHGFTCTTTKMQAYIDVDAAYSTSDLSALVHPIVGVQVVIPVKSLTCGGELENNMFNTLDATKYPFIIYKLSTYDLVTGVGSATSFAADTRGGLTISGKENQVAMRVTTTRNAAGLVTALGDETIKMTDFGIKPPRFMLGTLRVGNELKVKFTLKATSGAMAAAVTELTNRLAVNGLAAIGPNRPSR